MPLFEISDGNRLLRIQHKTFPEVELKERQHLQALLRENPSAISSDLLIIAEEFSNWEDSSRRIDLLALDRDANLVVIELKRVDDVHLELQAIRYAAMVAPMDFETAVETYRDFLSQRGLPSDSARGQILQFLNKEADEVEITSTPRIILISPSFSKEITTTILWLNDRGLNIRCMQARPYKLEGKLFMDLEQIIPLPSADAYLVSLGKKVLKAERQASKRRESSIAALQASGLLSLNTRLELIKPPRPSMKITDEKAKHATFLGEDGIQWDFDQQTYSLSAVCRRICEEFGADVGSGAFAGPDYWAIEGETVSLSQRAKALSSASSARDS